MSEEYICPTPVKWDEIYTKLLLYYEKNTDTVFDKPPVPLILNGWVFSSDMDKHIRWIETCNWIAKYYPDKSISSLKQNEMYNG